MIEIAIAIIVAAVGLWCVEAYIERRVSARTAYLGTMAVIGAVFHIAYTLRPIIDRSLVLFPNGWAVNF